MCMYWLLSLRIQLVNNAHKILCIRCGTRVQTFCFIILKFVWHATTKIVVAKNMRSIKRNREYLRMHDTRTTYLADSIHYIKMSRTFCFDHSNIHYIFSFTYLQSMQFLDYCFGWYFRDHKYNYYWYNKTETAFNTYYTYIETYYYYYYLVHIVCGCVTRYVA
jgi:hypothetical protein